MTHTHTHDLTLGLTLGLTPGLTLGHTCWRCVASRTAADSRPAAQRAAGRCRRGAAAAGPGSQRSCTAWSCSTREQRHTEASEAGRGLYMSLKGHVVCELVKQHCTSNSVSTKWPMYHSLAFLHDGGVHGGPDRDLLPLVVSHQVGHLPRDEELTD